MQADGTRYLLLANLLGTYLMDRSFRLRRVQMRFPCPGLKARHHCTLLDGEMVRLQQSCHYPTGSSTTSASSQRPLKSALLSTPSC